jgi:cysteine synthase
MVLHGEASGELTRDKTILDSTSGNTGIAYAMIGAARGYKVKLVMPGNVSPERKAIVQLYGAKSCCPANMKAATARFCWLARFTAKTRMPISSPTSTTTR